MAAASALAPSAMASVVINGTGLPAVSPTGSVSVDLDGAGGADFKFFLNRNTVGTMSGLPLGSGSVIGQWQNDKRNLFAFTSGFDAMQRFNQSSYVGGSQWGQNAELRFFRRYTASSVIRTRTRGPFGGGPNLYPGAGASEGFVGVEFYGGGGMHLGWIHLSIRNDAAGFPDALKILGWAYETGFDTPIHVKLSTVPEVPVPAAGLAALAMGAVGVQALRRRRQKTA